MAKNLGKMAQKNGRFGRKIGCRGNGLKEREELRDRIDHMLVIEKKFEELDLTNSEIHSTLEQLVSQDVASSLLGKHKVEGLEFSTLVPVTKLTMV